MIFRLCLNKHIHNIYFDLLLCNVPIVFSKAIRTLKTDFNFPSSLLVIDVNGFIPLNPRKKYIPSKQVEIKKLG